MLTFQCLTTSTTCYNVFNTTKDVGGKATCPMCDSAVAINEKNIVGDIKKQISDLTGKIGNEVKRAITGKTKEEPTLTIDGKKYDRELMNLVIAITKDRNEINLKDNKKIFPKISDYNDYTKIEKLEGWGKLSAQNLKYSINQKKNIYLERLIY